MPLCEAFFLLFRIYIYKAFLEKVIPLAAARHYGFTVEMLLKKTGLREFFGFPAIEGCL